jgi:hypothetical protein
MSLITRIRSGLAVVLEFLAKHIRPAPTPKGGGGPGEPPK